jgi:glycosyltransferase involved in cell wall biosynthesis
MIQRSKKVLIVSAHRPNRSPSQRFRYEQYIPFLEESGYAFTYSFLISEKDDLFFYKHGFYFEKAGVLLKSLFIRCKDVFRANSFDIIFIQREALMLGTSFFERLLSKKRAKIIFDFDDAIWFPNIEGGNKALSFLKKPGKTKDIIEHVDYVLAGNQYLADYAMNHNKNVTVIPTTIDLSYHHLNEISSKVICIGWTGSFSTLPYFELLLPVLKRLKDEFAQLQFKIIVDEEKYYSQIDTFTTKWSKSTEIDELNSISIGIMPLPNDEWTKGKCGFKGLQYMALKKACVMSAIGVNREIIESGVNGFLASTDEEWYNHLKNLINDEELRDRIAKKGYDTIKANYSVEGNKKKYLDLFDMVLRLKKQGN